MRLVLWLGVVRDAFVTLMPLTFFGLGAVLLQTLPWDAYQHAMAALGAKSWHERLNLIVLATHGVMGRALAPLIAAHLVRRLPSMSADGMDVSPVTAALSALINFMLFVFAQPVSSDSFGRNAMLRGIVVGIASAELLRQMMRVRWFAPARVPYDVESSFYFGIRLTLPVMASGLVMRAGRFQHQRIAHVRPADRAEFALPDPFHLRAAGALPAYARCGGERLADASPRGPDVDDSAATLRVDAHGLVAGRVPATARDLPEHGAVSTVRSQGGG
ncbi:hypothetical protein [Paraburkholderia phenazinium]|uniref:hypothetical protein n=1 Tax=Paraburkholderia phenazinium TaxID=60549 RepID=UPI001FD2D9FD|nr:hypothetical protein [Paraburkholderia phenazinium]